ncbi:type II toxin-antitoxin system VapC family toxin [Viscerimonas tarda]
MKRYYIDTNILIMLLDSQPNKRLSRRVYDILNDYGTVIFASSVVIMEIFYLFKRGKIDELRKYKSFEDLLKDINRLIEEVVYFDKPHMDLFYSIDLLDKDLDYNDLMILTQAIKEKTPLITNDHHFEPYEDTYKLKLIPNY